MEKEMEPQQSERNRRTVSVYGPFYVGNNCLKIPVSDNETEKNKNSRHSIDVSKYRIPTPNVSDRRKNSIETKLAQNKTITPTSDTSVSDTEKVTQDSGTQTSGNKLKRFKDIGKPPELFNKERIDIHNNDLDNSIASHRNTFDKNDGDMSHSTHIRYNDMPLPASKNDNLVENDYTYMSTKTFKKDTAFKISSTEDNYVLNKYKSKSVKPCNENCSGKSTRETERNSIKKNSPKEYFSKHRDKIARLKRRFFESLSHKDSVIGNASKEDTSNIDAFANSNTSTDSRIGNDDIKVEMTKANGHEMPDNEIRNNKNGNVGGFATESKATMMKKYGVGNNDKQRRYSSEVILGNNSMFTSGNWSPRKQESLTSYIVVVAIDFGTTYSGYAYSFIKDPEPVQLMRRQDGGDPGVFDQKIPTSILLTPDGHFHSFGYAAKEFYHDMEPSEAVKWMYFDRFKMLLHNAENLSKDTMLRSVSGRECSAMKVFSYSLKYFKDLVIQELMYQSTVSISCDMIRWVITVPAIWKASAKQFMRMAAYEAGILSEENPDQLLIALEPEAASIYCRRLRMLHLTLDDSKDSSSTVRTRSSLSLPDLQNEALTVRTDDLAIGTQYMVVDCGGGTVDITVHELQDGGRLKELHRATGGSHGSVGIDEEFEKLMKAVFGDDIIEQFKQRRPAGWVDLLAVFESRKRTASPYRTSHISISIPFSFIDFYKKCRGNSVEYAVKRYGDPDITWTSNGMLKLSPGTMRRLFLPTVGGIKQAIGNVLNDQAMQDLSYLFLVGGFAESSMVQHELREDFGSLLRVVIPPGVSMSILKGAVYFGMDPNIVEERCSCMTYGVGVLHRFDGNKHPLSKLVAKDGVDWCTDIFDAFVRVNQSVALGDSIIRRYTPVRRDQCVTVIHIYSTDRTDVTYVTDQGVTRCGTLSLKLDENSASTKTKIRREIRAEMMFGDTEIKVMATDVTSGLFVESAIDFINT